MTKQPQPAVNLRFHLGRYGSMFAIYPHTRTFKETSMKWHRFFAWTGAICMALAVYTGYKHA